MFVRSFIHLFFAVVVVVVLFLIARKRVPSKFLLRCLFYRLYLDHIAISLSSRQYCMALHIADKHTHPHPHPHNVKFYEAWILFDKNRSTIQTLFVWLRDGSHHFLHYIACGERENGMKLRSAPEMNTHETKDIKTRKLSVT